MSRYKITIFISLILYVFAGFVLAVEPYLTLNGQKTFQVGWYTRSPQSNPSKDFIDEPAANGFDFIMAYDIWGGGTANVLSNLTYAQSKGIKVMMPCGC